MAQTATANPEIELSLVLPAYNEAAGIEQTVRSAFGVLEGLGVSYEVIVVNDGSSDATGAVLSQLAVEAPALRPVQLRRNVGQHIATVVGLRQARGRYVVTADADEQVPFTNIATLLRAAQADDGADVISGARSQRSGALYRDLGSRAVTWIVNRSTGQRLQDPATTFRLFRREALAEMLNADALVQNIPILVGHLGLAVREVPVESQVSGGRKSNYDLWKLINALLLALLNFSAGTTTILTLMASGVLAFGAGVAGLIAVVVYGLAAQTALPTNWLLFFVLLVVLGLQFVLVGAVAYKIERLNVNLRFRRHVDPVRDDRIR